MERHFLIVGLCERKQPWYDFVFCLFCFFNSQRLVQRALLGRKVGVGVFLPNPKESAESGKGSQSLRKGKPQSVVETESGRGS